MNNVNDIKRNHLCLGCGACAVLSENIEIVDNHHYGLRPSLKEGHGSADKPDTALADYCPGITLNRNTLSDYDKSSQLQKSWGPVHSVYEGYAVDPDIRYRASSGGIATALGVFALKEDQYSQVLLTTSDDNHPILNKSFVTSSDKDVLNATGSRYSPSSPIEQLKTVVNNKKSCFFIGKPCDCAALHNLKQVSSDIHDYVGLSLSVFCAGVPSTEGSREMLEQMGYKEGMALQSLRYRGHGWPGTACAEFLDHSNKLQSVKYTYRESWDMILQKFRQWRCRICPDHTGQFSDISVGDLWNKKSDDNPGLSIVIARNKAAADFLDAAVQAGYISLSKIDSSNIAASQPNLLGTKSNIWGRLFAMRLMGMKTPVFKGFSLFSLWLRHLNFIAKNRSILGTVKRIITRELKKGEINRKS